MQGHQTAKLANLLEAEGIPQARAIVTQVFEQHAGATPGTIYGDVDSLGITRIWERATFAGIRKMVLEIEAQSPTLAADDGLLTVRVLDSQQWPEWDDDQEARAAGLAGMVAALDVPDSWNNAVQEAACDGAKTAEQWEAEAKRIQAAAARARAERLN